MVVGSTDVRVFIYILKIPLGALSLYIYWISWKKNCECVAIENTHNHTNLHQKAIQLLFRKTDQKLDCSICFLFFITNTEYSTFFNVCYVVLSSANLYIRKTKPKRSFCVLVDGAKKKKSENKTKTLWIHNIYANCRKIVQQTK